MLLHVQILKMLSGSDHSSSSLVSGAVLPPLVRLRYCNAVSISHSVSFGGLLCSSVTQCVFVTEGSLTTHLTLLHYG